MDDFRGSRLMDDYRAIIKSPNDKLKTKPTDGQHKKHTVEAQPNPPRTKTRGQTRDKHVYTAKGRRRHASNTKTPPPCFHRSEFFTGDSPRRCRNRHRKPTGTRITINENTSFRSYPFISVFQVL
ncbi:hypothetical protein Bca4012_101515 [Brassica carinata]